MLHHDTRGMRRWQWRWHTPNTFVAWVPRLQHRLGDIARKNGLQHFVAEVLAENHSLLQVLSDGGWPRTRHLEDSVLHVEIDLGVQPSLAER